MRETFLEGLCRRDEFASSFLLAMTCPNGCLYLELLPSLSYPVCRVAFEAARWYEQPGMHSIARRVLDKLDCTSEIPPKQSVGGRESC